MIQPLYEKINYISGVPFVFSRFIREYDISKANISILYSKGIISEDLYNQLYNSDRMERQIFIGNLQKQNPKIVKALQQGIVEAKKNLFLANNLSNEDILTIKNDAVFTIDRDLRYTKFGNIEFKLKNLYTSFMRIDRLEFYYSFNRITKEEKMDVKGLGKKQYLHQEYMTDFIEYIMNSIESGDIENIITNFTSFYRSYINRELPIYYYREYNPYSYYRIYGTNYCLDYLNNTVDNIMSLDISYNNYILTCIYKYISSIYMNQ